MPGESDNLMNMARGINIYSFSDIQNNYFRYVKKTILDIKIHVRILDTQGRGRLECLPRLHQRPGQHN